MARSALATPRARLAFSALLIAIGGYNVWLRENVEAQLLIFGMLLALTGLPHGAVDPAIARQAGLWRGIPGLLKFSVGYLALSVAVVGCGSFCLNCSLSRCWRFPHGIFPATGSAISVGYRALPSAPQSSHCQLCSIQQRCSLSSRCWHRREARLLWTAWCSYPSPARSRRPFVVSRRSSRVSSCWRNWLFCSVPLMPCRPLLTLPFTFASYTARFILISLWSNSAG